MVCTAQPMHESRIVAATPPCTEPIGLYIHSAGSIANSARPGSTSTIVKSSSRAIGGGGNVPSTIAPRYSIPVILMPDSAIAAGSSQLKLRVRSCPIAFTEDTLTQELHHATLGPIGLGGHAVAASLITSSPDSRAMRERGTT